jgi:hypothetical protein
MKLVVNNSQLKNYKMGKPFQLTKDQLAGHFNGGALFEIEVPDYNEKIVKKAQRLTKGVRLVHHGGSIESAFKSVVKSANKTGKQIEKTANKTGDAIVKTANDVDKWAKKVDLGGYVEDMKKAVPQSTMTIILTSALVAGATATGNPALIAAAPVLAASASTAFYKADFSRNLNGQGEAVGMAALKSGVSEGMKASKKSSAKTPAATEGGSLNPYLNPFLVDPSATRPRGRPRKDVDIMGRGFQPTGSGFKPSGSGFKEVGSGFQPTGSGFPRSNSQSHMVKGSPAALDWAERMREARMRNSR